MSKYDVNIRKKILFPILLIPLFLFSENNDTLLKKENPTLYFTESQFASSDSGTYINNSLYNFQNYLERNHLGNSGLAFNSLFLPTFSKKNGFVYAKNNYQNYFTSTENIKYYDTKKPHTDLFYKLGSKKEQNFDMLFSYNVKKNWNLTTTFKRIRSDGFYSRQKTNNNTLSLSSNYKSQNNRYYLLASVIYNKAQNEENGGVVEDSTLLSNLAFNLSGASRSTANQSVSFKQYLNFGEKTTDTAKLNTVISKSRLILTSKAENHNYIYEDNFPDSDFYTTIYNDSVSTFDSTNYYTVANELKWKRLDNKQHRGFKDMMGFGISAKHQLVTIRQNDIGKTSDNISAGIELYNTYSNNMLWWNISMNYTFDGYNKNNYSTGIHISKTLKDSANTFIFKAHTKAQNPDFIYNRYATNYFKWNNNFSLVKENYLGIHFLSKKINLSIGANYHNYQNLVYFNTQAIAAQHGATVSVVRAFLNKDVKLYKFHLNNKVNYQYVPDNSVIRLPEFVLEHSLYFESDMFKKALKIQIGASLFYVSAYYANAYMPATGQFYLQSNQKYGEYPFIDFFINAQVKNFRVFFKIDHLNSGWSGDNYVMTPNYPKNTRAFKLGISWRFFD